MRSEYGNNIDLTVRAQQQVRLITNCRQVKGWDGHIRNGFPTDQEQKKLLIDFPKFAPLEQDVLIQIILQIKEKGTKEFDPQGFSIKFKPL